MHALVRACPHSACCIIHSACFRMLKTRIPRKMPLSKATKDGSKAFFFFFSVESIGDQKYWYVSRCSVVCACMCVTNREGKLGGRMGGREKECQLSTRCYKSIHMLYLSLRARDK